MKKAEDTAAAEQQRRLLRNRSILLCRDLLEMNDWIILACKRSSLPHESVRGDASELVSLSVLGPGEKVLLDVLVRPEAAVASELLKIHGCDPAHAFNAPTCQQIHKILQAGFARTRVLTWNQEKTKTILSGICRQHSLPELEAVYLDLQSEFAHFTGTTVGSRPEQGLPDSSDSSKPQVPPLAECQYLLALVFEMAGSSQISEGTSFNKNWSAAFYKPKVGPTKKLKEFLGLND